MATEVATTEERPSAQVPALTPEGERFALRQRQAKMFAMSPLVPEHLRKGSAEQAIANCWIALTLAEAMGEVPLIVMQNIHIVNGKAGFASQYMIARANNSGIFKGRIDWRIDRGNAENLAVTAFATLKETGTEVSVTCDMKMARAEGWTKNAKYTTMPEVMLRYRSAAFLVRFYAPDVMLGYQTSEEIEDVVLAARPAAEPLTSKMLIDQSQSPADEPAAEIVDEETGEITVEDEQPEVEEDRQPTEAADQTTYSLADQIGLDEHPGKAIADRIIAEINAPETNAEMDVTSITASHEAHIAAMLDEDAIRVEVAADKRRNEIRAAREAVPAK